MSDNGNVNGNGDNGSTAYWVDGLPEGWAEMTGETVGSKWRNVRETGGSKLLFAPDLNDEGLWDDMLDEDDTITFDFIDIALPSLAATPYSTAILAQRKWATQGVSRIIAGDQISGTIECPGEVYAAIASMISVYGTARIEIPNQGWFSQWRVAILSVDGPALMDGDRMTGTLVLTVTNTGADFKSEVGPVFGMIDDEEEVTPSPP